MIGTGYYRVGLHDAIKWCSGLNNDWSLCTFQVCFIGPNGFCGTNMMLFRSPDMSIVDSQLTWHLTSEMLERWGNILVPILNFLGSNYGSFCRNYGWFGITNYFLVGSTKDLIFSIWFTWPDYCGFIFLGNMVVLQALSLAELILVSNQMVFWLMC